MCIAPKIEKVYHETLLNETRLRMRLGLEWDEPYARLGVYLQIKLEKPKAHCSIGKKDRF